MLSPIRELLFSFILIISLGKTSSLPFPVLDNLKAPIVAELDTSKIRNYIDKVVDNVISNVTREMLEQLERGVEKVIKDELKNVSTKLESYAHQTTKPKECMDIISNHDGIYTIYPNAKDPVTVYCIMDGYKKWTVIQRRMDGSVNFDRTWSEYKMGFGSINGEYWLGNDNIHLISSNGHHEISFYLGVSAQKFGYANYSTFSVGDEQSKYILTITGYSGNTSDSMDKTNNPNAVCNGRKFTTLDQDNDSYSGNCAVLFGGGWWHNNCFYADLNSRSATIYWQPYSPNLTKSIMMIRKA